MLYRCNQCGWSHDLRSIPKACPKCQQAKKLGLGDRVAAIVDRLGGKLYKQLYKKIFGKKCGCEKRQAWLNQFGQWFYSDRKHDPS